MARTWDQAKLERVQSSRTLPPEGKPLAALLPEDGATTLGGDARARAVFEALLGAGDVDFRRFCRFDSFRSGELVLLVEDPAELYGQRTRWTAALLTHLQAACPQAKVRRVVFREGTGGAVLAESPDSGTARRAKKRLGR